MKILPCACVGEYEYYIPRVDPNTGLTRAEELCPQFLTREEAAEYIAEERRQAKIAGEA